MPFKSTPEARAAAVELHHIREEQAAEVDAFVEQLKAEGTPLGPKQHVTSKWEFSEKLDRQEPRLVADNTVFRSGSAIVQKNSRGTWDVIDARTGLAFVTFFSRRRDAVALTKSLGPKLDAYFERCARGDARAHAALARLCWMHSTRHLRRE